MKNEEKTEKASEERELTPGEKFLKEYLEMPYTNDRVGQAFVIIRPGLRIAVNKKSDADCEDNDHSNHDK
jgi:hypothetical protein